MKTKKLIKLIAAVLVPAFLAQDLAFAAPEFKAADLAFFKPSTVRFEIPRSVALIEDSFQAVLRTPNSPRQTLYLIQDAHTNASAQLNTAKALDLLLRKENIKTIFLEAGTGNDSLSYLRESAPLAKRERVAKSFVKQGELSGAEFLDLTSERPFVLWGVEDAALYQESIEAYRRVAAKREALGEYLKKIEASIKTLKPKLFNPSLAALDEKREATLGEKIPLTEYCDAFLSEASRLKVPLSYFPHLQSFKKLKEKEDQIDFAKANEEQAKLIGESGITPSKLQAGDHPEQEGFYALLEENLKDKNIYPELSKYLTYLKEARKIDPEKLLDEQKALEHQIFARSIQTEDERNLHRSSENLRLLKKLFDLTLTPSDYWGYKNQFKAFTIADMTGFLNRKVMDLKDHYDRVVFLEGGYDDHLKNAERFYELTFERDAAFIRNALKKMEEEGETKAVLVTGGYHGPNLKALLKKANISYVSVRPQVTHETNHARYERILFRRALGAEKAGISVAAKAAENQSAVIPIFQYKKDLARLESALGKSLGVREKPSANGLAAGDAVERASRTPSFGARLAIEEEIAQLIKQLGDKKDAKARSSAALDLGDFGPQAKEAVPALIKVLEDPDESVRVHATQTLGEIGPQTEEVIPALIKVLMKDSYWKVRYSAAMALGEFGPQAKEAVPALIKALEDPVWDVATHAHQALGQIGPAAESAIPALEALKKERQGFGYFTYLIAQAIDKINGITGKEPSLPRPASSHVSETSGKEPMLPSSHSPSSGPAESGARPRRFDSQGESAGARLALDPIRDDAAARRALSFVQSETIRVLNMALAELGESLTLKYFSGKVHLQDIAAVFATFSSINIAQLFPILIAAKIGGYYGLNEDQQKDIVGFLRALQRKDYAAGYLLDFMEGSLRPDTPYGRWAKELFDKASEELSSVPPSAFGARLAASEDEPLPRRAGASGGPAVEAHDDYISIKEITDETFQSRTYGPEDLPELMRLAKGPGSKVRPLRAVQIYGRHGRSALLKVDGKKFDEGRMEAIQSLASSTIMNFFGAEASPARFRAFFVFDHTDPLKVTEYYVLILPLLDDLEFSGSYILFLAQKLHAQMIPPLWKLLTPLVLLLLVPLALIAFALSDYGKKAFDQAYRAYNGYSYERGKAERAAEEARAQKNALERVAPKTGNEPLVILKKPQGIVWGVRIKPGAKVYAAREYDEPGAQVRFGGDLVLEYDPVTKKIARSEVEYEWKYPTGGGSSWGGVRYDGNLRYVDRREFGFDDNAPYYRKSLEEIVGGVKEALERQEGLKPAEREVLRQTLDELEKRKRKVEPGSSGARLAKADRSDKTKKNKIGEKQVGERGWTRRDLIKWGLLAGGAVPAGVFLILKTSPPVEKPKGTAQEKRPPVKQPEFIRPDERFLASVKKVLSRIQQDGWITENNEMLVAVLNRLISDRTSWAIVDEQAEMVMRIEDSVSYRMLVNGKHMATLSDEEIEGVLVHESHHLLPSHKERFRLSVELEKRVPLNRRSVADEAFRRDFKRSVAMDVRNELEAYVAEFAYRRRQAQALGYSSLSSYFRDLIEKSRSSALRERYQGYVDMWMRGDGQLDEDTVSLSMVLQVFSQSPAQKQFLEWVGAYENNIPANNAAGWFKGPGGRDWLLPWLKDPKFYNPGARLATKIGEPETPAKDLVAGARLAQDGSGVSSREENLERLIAPRRQKIEELKNKLSQPEPGNMPEWLTRASRAVDQREIERLEKEIAELEARRFVSPQVPDADEARFDVLTAGTVTRILNAALVISGRREGSIREITAELEGRITTIRFSDPTTGSLKIPKGTQLTLKFKDPNGARPRRFDSQGESAGARLASLENLIKDLGSPDEEVWTEAARAIEAEGMGALSALMQAAPKGSLIFKGRVAQLIENIGAASLPNAGRTSRESELRATILLPADRSTDYSLTITLKRTGAIGTYDAELTLVIKPRASEAVIGAESALDRDFSAPVKAPSTVVPVSVREFSAAKMIFAVLSLEARRRLENGSWKDAVLGYEAYAAWVKQNLMKNEGSRLAQSKPVYDAGFKKILAELQSYDKPGAQRKFSRIVTMLGWLMKKPEKDQALDNFYPDGIAAIRQAILRHAGTSIPEAAFVSVDENVQDLAKRLYEALRGARLSAAGDPGRVDAYAHMDAPKFIAMTERILKRPLTDDERKNAGALISEAAAIRRNIDGSGVRLEGRHDVVTVLNEMLLKGGHPRVCIQTTQQATALLDRLGVPNALVRTMSFMDSDKPSTFYPPDKGIDRLWSDYGEGDTPSHYFNLFNFLGIPMVLELSGDQFVKTPDPGPEWGYLGGKFTDIGIVIIPVAELRGHDWPYVGGYNFVHEGNGLHLGLLDVLGGDRELAARFVQRDAGARLALTVTGAATEAGSSGVRSKLDELFEQYQREGLKLTQSIFFDSKVLWHFEDTALTDEIVKKVVKRFLNHGKNNPAYGFFYTEVFMLVRDRIGEALLEPSLDDVQRARLQRLRKIQLFGINRLLELMQDSPDKVELLAKRELESFEMLEKRYILAMVKAFQGNMDTAVKILTCEVPDRKILREFHMETALSYLRERAKLDEARRTNKAAEETVPFIVVRNALVKTLEEAPVAEGEDGPEKEQRIREQTERRKWALTTYIAGFGKEDNVMQTLDAKRHHWEALRKYREFEVKKLLPLALSAFQTLKQDPEVAAIPIEAFDALEPMRPRYQAVLFRAVKDGRKYVIKIAEPGYQGHEAEGVNDTHLDPVFDPILREAWANYQVVHVRRGAKTGADLVPSFGYGQATAAGAEKVKESLRVASLMDLNDKSRAITTRLLTSFAKGVSYLVFEDAGAEIPEEGLEGQPREAAEDIAFGRFTSAAKIMAFFHQNGITHRDLSWSQIMTDEKGVSRLIDLATAVVKNEPALTESTIPAEKRANASPFYGAQGAFYGEDEKKDNFALLVMSLYLLKIYGLQSLIDNDQPLKETPLATFLQELSLVGDDPRAARKYFETTLPAKAFSQANPLVIPSANELYSYALWLNAKRRLKRIHAQANTAYPPPSLENEGKLKQLLREAEAAGVTTDLFKADLQVFRMEREWNEIKARLKTEPKSRWRQLVLDRESSLTFRYYLFISNLFDEDLKNEKWSRLLLRYIGKIENIKFTGPIVQGIRAYEEQRLQSASPLKRNQLELDIARRIQRLKSVDAALKDAGAVKAIKALKELDDHLMYEVEIDGARLAAAEDLRDDLESQDARERREAVIKLVTGGTEAHVPLLIPILRDPDPVMRQYAAINLGRINENKTGESVDHSIVALEEAFKKESSENVKPFLVEALGKIGRAALPVLRAIAENMDETDLSRATAQKYFEEIQARTSARAIGKDEGARLAATRVSAEISRADLEAFAVKLYFAKKEMTRRDFALRFGGLTKILSLVEDKADGEVVSLTLNLKKAGKKTEPILVIYEPRKKLEELQRGKKDVEVTPQDVATALAISEQNSWLSVPAVVQETASSFGIHVPLGYFAKLKDPAHFQAQFQSFIAQAVRHMERSRRDRKEVKFLFGDDDELEAWQRSFVKDLIDGEAAFEFASTSKPFDGVVINLLEAEKTAGEFKKDDRRLYLSIAEIGSDGDSVLSWHKAFAIANWLGTRYALDPRTGKINLEKVKVTDQDLQQVVGYFAAHRKDKSRKFSPELFLRIVTGQASAEDFRAFALDLPILKRIPLQVLLHAAQNALRAVGRAA
jgi:HEAT repeat protein/serine/threonine protein kinase